MKKKILFVNYSLHSGGVEKSLVTLLSLFNYEKYDVSLQLFIHEGLFMNRVPKKVKLLPPLLPTEYRQNVVKAFFQLVKKGMIKTAFLRLLVTLVSKSGTLGKRLARVYKIEKLMLKKNPEEYDCVIAFMEGQPLYYSIDFVKAKRRIAFIHGDYEAMELCREFDTPYIKKLDALCTVSDSCKKALDRVFDEPTPSHHVIYNIISKSQMLESAKASKGFTDNFSGTRILTIARLSYQKGLDVGIRAIAEIRDLDFKWYIIGIGPMKAELERLAKELCVSDKIEFLGETPDPYPYLNECDIYFQPSRFEGKAIAVDEACVFLKPILLADYSTSKDQITHGYDGLIYPFDPKELALGLSRLIQDKKLCLTLSENLKNKDRTNESEAQKLYCLIDGDQ